MSKENIFNCYVDQIEKTITKDLTKELEIAYKGFEGCRCLNCGKRLEIARQALDKEFRRVSDRPWQDHEELLIEFLDQVGKK